eukprot:SAG25_NODE_5_length_29351_cov_43.404335_16_plen_369_part_00
MPLLRHIRRRRRRRGKLNFALLENPAPVARRKRQKKGFWVWVSMRAAPTTLTMLIPQVDVEAAWQLLSTLDAASGGGGGDLFGEGEHAGEFVACPIGVGRRVRLCAGRLTEGAAHRHVRGDGQRRCQPHCRGRGQGAGASEGCVRRLCHCVAHVGLGRTCARIDSELAMPGVDLGSFLRAMDDACAAGGRGELRYAAGVDGPRTAGATAGAGSGFLLRLRQAVRAVLPGPAEQREHAGLARTPAVDAQADTEEEEEEEEVVASAAAEGAEEEQRGQGGAGGGGHFAGGGRRWRAAACLGRCRRRCAAATVLLVTAGVARHNRGRFGQRGWPAASPDGAPHAVDLDHQRRLGRHRLGGPAVFYCGSGPY